MKTVPPSRAFESSGLRPASRGVPLRQVQARKRMAWLGGLLMVVMVATDYLALGLGPFREGAPDLGWTGLWRCAAFGVGMLAVAAAAAGASTARYARTEAQAHTLWPGDAFGRGAVVFAAAVGVCAPLLLIVSPSGYDAIVLEDGVVEWSQAVLLLGASLTSAASLWRLRDGRTHSLAVRVAIGLFSVVCFCIAGEEVSWLQRVIGFSTPDAMAQANMQGEFNLHNVATNHVENAYYFCAGFVLLAALPLWRAFGLPFGRLQPLAPLVPRLHLVAIGALVVAYNYDMWNGAATQLAFWGTAAGVAFHASAAPPRAATPWWLLAAAMVLVQLVLLAFGAESARVWDHTEYKELLISWGLWVYAVDLRALRH